ncbi:MAG: hypothetical protein ACT4PJ_01865 [Gemmatimonadaceae bacterium]
MKRLVALFIAGIIVGYFYGFADAKTHRDNVVRRVVATVGGSNRDRVSGDVDARMEALEKGRR